jgi:N-terminal acetyltransferase B complex non-catalytic subunit
METGPVTSADLLAACQTYYDRNSTKLYCFGDLQRYVTSLGEEETSKLVDYVLEKTDVSSKGSSVSLFFVSNLL